MEILWGSIHGTARDEGRTQGEVDCNDQKTGQQRSEHSLRDRMGLVETLTRSGCPSGETRWPPHHGLGLVVYHRVRFPQRKGPLSYVMPETHCCHKTWERSCHFLKFSMWANYF